MKRTSLNRGSVAGLLLLALATVGAALSAPAAGQDVERTECRCVDADGNVIEDCTCVRAPPLSRVLSGLGHFDEGRPRLGISVDVTAAPDAEVEGARVVDVLEDGPADEAGLREGDVITHVDGRSLSEPIGSDAERDFDLDGSVPAQRLLALARRLEPGASVEIAYVRDGRQRTVTVEAEDLADRWGSRLSVVRPDFDRQRLQGDLERLRERLEELGDGARAWRFRAHPDDDAFFHREGPRGDVRIFDPDDAFLLGGIGSTRGLELTGLNPALGRYFGTDSGVLVVDVHRSSTLGLEPGDVVLAVDGREVTTPQHLRRILASYAVDEEMQLTIVRDGAERTLTAPMRRP